MKKDIDNIADYFCNTLMNPNAELYKTIPIITISIPILIMYIAFFLNLDI